MLQVWTLAPFASWLLQVDIINSTLGKALGGATGGYTTGRADVVALLRQKSRPYLFSNTLAPAVAAASLTVFEMLESDTALKDKLDGNTALFRRSMREAGFKLGDSPHPIVVRAGHFWLFMVYHACCGACSMSEYVWQHLQTS